MIHLIIVVSGLGEDGVDYLKGRGVGSDAIQQRVVVKLGILKYGIKHFSYYWGI